MYDIAAIITSRFLTAIAAAGKDDSSSSCSSSSSKETAGDYRALLHNMVKLVVCPLPSFHALAHIFCVKMHLLHI